jgi:heme-degrading monooxygenase HmoA
MAGMVLEVARFDVRPGTEAEFAAAYRQVRQAVASSTGCRSMRMTSGVETPTRFVLLVEWDSIDQHEAFRASERFVEWRAGIGPYFANPPQVEHFTDLTG